MQVKNEYLKNKAIKGAIGVIKFNAEGIANIEDEKYAEALIELANFSKVEETTSEASETSSEVIKDEDAVKPLGEEEINAKKQELAPLGVMQLKKLAKDKGIDLGNASKKQEIIEIIASNM